MFLILMGVSGSGKTTTGQLAAKRLGWPFYEGDDYHPPQNVAKMAAGVPLNDQDRAGWLASLADLVSSAVASGSNGILACSALKRQYRRILAGSHPGEVKFIFLKGPFNLIRDRMGRRSGHYMSAGLLSSQFAVLEEPPGAYTLDITLPPEEIADRIVGYAMRNKPALGIIGLGVMGRSLAANFSRHGYDPTGYDIVPHSQADVDFRLASSPQELAGLLPAPRILLVMVPAGDAVNASIASVKPYLSPGDVVIDGGNSFFLESERHAVEMERDGFLFVGMGVSGGESGALWGPSLMPGGSAPAWETIQPMLEAIAARAPDGLPCVDWMGPGGSGHYIKMVHNGIEYADMQLIAEVYDLLHRGAGLSNSDLSRVFAAWNEGELKSYLVEITARILARVDDLTGLPLVDVILDEAAQKGTGKWASQNSMDTGAPVPAITAAVESRLISALKQERLAASAVLGGRPAFQHSRESLVAAAGQALYAAKVTAYAQGLALLGAASSQYGWNLDIARVVPLWRAGCIIRAALLEDITAAYRQSPGLPNLLLFPAFTGAVRQREAAWRKVVSTAVLSGIPVPGLAASLAYFDAYRSETLPANLVQAQRDYFGAHTYRRTDREGIFHTAWEDPIP